MKDIWPKILRTTRRKESPWIELITRDVQFSAQGATEAYDAIGQQDYCVALAVTPDARILLVRQFRPAIERFSLEFPAGMIELGESADSAIARELLEETGFPAETIEPIGETATSAGRISNSTHSFFIRTGARVVGFAEEPGVSVSLVTADQLRGLILSGEFSEQCHLGVIALACARSLITF